jgi:hypothetical protein
VLHSLFSSAVDALAPVMDPRLGEGLSKIKKEVPKLALNLGADEVIKTGVLLDMDITLEQGLTWLIDLVKQYDADTLRRESAAKVKIECSRRASDLLTRAMEICGAVACLDEFGLMRHCRDLFVCRVGEGSNFALKTLATRPLMPRIADLLQ